jgi:hypothetical protein
VVKYELELWEWGDAAMKGMNGDGNGERKLE